MPRKPEKLDDTPVAIPVKIKRLQQDTVRMQELIRAITARDAEGEMDTFEEADDFLIDNDDMYDMSSPWEEMFDPEGESIGYLDQNGYTKAPPPDPGPKASSDNDEGKGSGGVGTSEDKLRPGGQGSDQSQK